MGIDTTGSIVATGTDEMPVRRSDEDPCTDAEIESAYMFAHEHGLTTMPTCMTARTEDFLTRGEAAKMISNYAMNVMEMSPDADMKCMFSDMTSVGSEMQ